MPVDAAGLLASGDAARGSTASPASRTTLTPQGPTGCAPTTGVQVGDIRYQVRAQGGQFQPELIYTPQGAVSTSATDPWGVKTDTLIEAAPPGRVQEGLAYLVVTPVALRLKPTLPAHHVLTAPGRPCSTTNAASVSR
jgi:hypothetical protein